MLELASQIYQMLLYFKYGHEDGYIMVRFSKYGDIRRFSKFCFDVQIIL